MCGNGIRCVAKYIYEKNLIDISKCSQNYYGRVKFVNSKIETLSGIRDVQVKVEANKVTLVEVEMGKPNFEPQKIPIYLNEKENSQRLILNYENQKFAFCCVSMGNPHAVTIVRNVENTDVNKYGKIFENDAHFPERSNIEFVEILDRRNIKMRVWERGSGETLACGTGACAAAIVCMKMGLVEPFVNVRLRGGTLLVHSNINSNKVLFIKR